MAAAAAAAATAAVGHHPASFVICGWIWTSMILVPCFSDGLLIGSFNVQIFGQKKSSDREVMKVLTRIIERYDIVVIQEIKDVTNKSLDRLMSDLNRKGTKYFHETSARLGSTNSTEQYSFLIRKDSGLGVIDRFQYPETLKSFERPPFSIRLRSTTTGIKEFVLSVIHTRPDSAVQEIGKLEEVHSVLVKRWNISDVLIMGDLNADCRYASKTKLNELSIRRDGKFMWLIPDDADTTVHKTNCAYDRFILTGEKFKRNLVANSAGIFHFDKEFDLTNDQAKAVSDHYPIELRLNSTGNPRRQMQFESSATTSLMPAKLLIVALAVYDVWR